MTNSTLTPAEAQPDAELSSEVDPHAIRASFADADPETLSRHELVMAGYAKENLRWGNLSWVVIVWIAAMHVGCLAAPFYFSWEALAVCAVMHWLTASIGICLGYHRYLAHQSMKLKSPAEFFVLMCGAISGEGSPCHWAATHRVHHQKSDKPGDPHSPTEGSWWSHLLWLFPHQPKAIQAKLHETYVPDIYNRPLVQFFERTYVFWLLAPTFVLGTVGWFVGGVFGMLSMVLWGVCVRTTLCYHSTWFVNSATHLWGYKNYQTRDDSRNLWWVAILAYGEGWHNNHHAHPSVAPAGHRWWEVDITYWSIRVLRLLGLATEIKDNIPERNAKAADDAPLPHETQPMVSTAP